jgi:hypothetical protein
MFAMVPFAPLRMTWKAAVYWPGAVSSVVPLPAPKS